MKEIKNMQAFEATINQDKPVLLDFYADWCGPCQALLPTVQKLADKYEDDFIVQKVNVDHFPALSQKFGVRSIPALFVVKDKKIVQKLVGYQSEKKLESVITAHLAEA